MGPPRPLDGNAVDELRARPALRGAQDDHGPGGPLPDRPRASLGPDPGDLVEGGVEGRGHPLVHHHGVFTSEATLHHQWVISVPGEKGLQLGVGDPGEHRGVGDLVSVEVQDREHRAVTDRVEELVGVPARCQSAGLGLPVADDTGDDEVGVVERRPVRMCEPVTELAPFVDRARRLRSGVARDPPGEGELPEQTGHTPGVSRHVGVQLAVGPFQPRVGHHGRAHRDRARRRTGPSRHGG